MSYESQVEQLGRWIDENMSDEPIAPPVERAIDIMKRQKEKYESLEKEFREYVNRPGPSKDYIASGGWRK
jgi:hypothetical protein